MSDRCPFAESCWMGGGSYACVKTPPFCKEPLIPKETVIRVPEPEPDHRVDAMFNIPLPPFDPIAVTLPIQSAIKQGELF